MVVLKASSPLSPAAEELPVYHAQRVDVRLLALRRAGSSPEKIGVFDPSYSLKMVPKTPNAPYAVARTSGGRRARA